MHAPLCPCNSSKRTRVFLEELLFGRRHFLDMRCATRALSKACGAWARDPQHFSGFNDLCSFNVSGGRETSNCERASARAPVLFRWLAVYHSHSTVKSILIF